MNKNLLSLATIIAASSLLLGGCASNVPSESSTGGEDLASSSLAQDTQEDSSIEELDPIEARLIEIVKGIANNLFGTSVEGEDWLYDADYDVYLTGAVIPGVTPDEAILVAEEFLIDGYTLDTEPFYSEEYGDYEAYFSYDNGTIYVDALAYVDEADSSCSDLEFWVYVPEEE